MTLCKSVIEVCAGDILSHLFKRMVRKKLHVMLGYAFMLCLFMVCYILLCSVVISFPLIVALNSLGTVEYEDLKLIFMLS